MSSEVADADVRTRFRGRWELLVVASLAVATVVVMLDAGGWGAASSSSTGGVGWTVGFLLWGVSPFVGAGAVVVAGSRELPRGRMALVVGVAALAVLTVLALASFGASESSTSALLFLFLPFYQWLLVAVTAGATALVHALRGRRSRTEGLRKG